MSKHFKIFFIAFIPLLTACSSDYINVIPSESTVLMSLDPKAIGNNIHNDNALKTLLLVDDTNDCGIDLREKLYAFEAADGTFGLVAKVSDIDDVVDWMTRLADKGICSKPIEHKGYKFAVIYGNFIAGLSNDALLIMGPSVGAEQAELQKKMVKYLKAKEEHGIRKSQMYERIEQMQGAIALVAQAQALPDKLTSPLTLSVPKGTSLSDIYIAASIEIDTNGVVEINGENFSFDTSIDNALKDAASQYKPITGKYIKAIPNNVLIAMICGVNGEEYIKQLRSNESLRTMLIGLNTTIDIDMMLKSVEGDMLICVPQAKEGKMDFQMIADVNNSNWLKDVDYWKTSCPKGTLITNWKGKDAFHITSPDWDMYFGLTASNQLFFGSNEQLAQSAGQQPLDPLPADVQKMLEGKRLCVLLNLQSLAEYNPNMTMAIGLVKHLFGNVNTIIYSIK